MVVRLRTSRCKRAPRKACPRVTGVSKSQFVFLGRTMVQLRNPKNLRRSGEWTPELLFLISGKEAAETKLTLESIPSDSPA